MSSQFTSIKQYTTDANNVCILCEKKKSLFWQGKKINEISFSLKETIAVF